VTPTLVREFASSDEEMKKIVLKVVKQCVGTEGGMLQCAFVLESTPMVPLTLPTFASSTGFHPKGNPAKLLQTLLDSQDGA
jgi:hypothetical protein